MHLFDASEGLKSTVSNHGCLTESVAIKICASCTAKYELKRGGCGALVIRKSPFMRFGVLYVLSWRVLPVAGIVSFRLLIISYHAAQG